jgi:hypothetical protein
MAACHFCSKSHARMYQLNDGGIMCLDCYSKFQATNESTQRGLERMINYLSDSIDSTFGIPMNSPRFPEPKPPVYMQNPTLNSLTIQDSVVGAVNQGSVQSMNVSLSNINQTHSKEAQLVKTFTEMMLKSQELEKEQKEEILDQLTYLTGQLAKPKEKRNHPVIKTMTTGITNILKSSKFLLDMWVVINVIFGGNIPSQTP